MKIGILTFPHSPSLGAMLQMRSLYHALEDMGYEVEIVNYVSPKVNHQKKKKLTPKGLLIKVLSKCFIKSSAPSFREFEAPLKMFPEVPSYDQEALDAIAARFDRIIVGSDQVWNPVVTGYDKNFYLEFCSDPAKKASYAASFGYAHIEEHEQKRVGELLNEFAYLSVREKDGAEIVKSLTGRDAEVVLDPTLLVESDYLRSLSKPAERNKKYVLFFTIKPSPALYRRAAEYAERYGLELVTIGGRMKDRFDPNKHPAFGVGPKEFLGLLDGAECVFTNSFHGTAVSIALHTDFYVEFSSDTNSRLDNLTSILNLRDRIVTEETLTDEKIDYSSVDVLLSEHRADSMEYLKKVVAE